MSCDELPDGWTLAPLSDLGAWHGGGTPSKAVARYWADGDIPWVSPKDMKTDCIHATEDYVTDEAVEQSAAKLIPAGAVLVVTRSGILAHTFPVATTSVDVTVNQDLKALVPQDGIEAAFVASALRAAGQTILRDCSKDGVTVQSVDTDRLLAFHIPVAPTPEQRRIVEAIESYFTRLDEAVAGLERVQRNLERYRASVLQAAVEGRLVPTEAELARAEGRDYEPASVLLQRILAERRRRWEEAELAKFKANGKPPKDDRWKAKYEEPAAPDTRALSALPEGWCWATADAVGDVLLGRQRAPQYLTGLWSRPYLRVANVKDDRLDVADLESMDFEPDHFAKYSLEVGDILVSEGQSPHLVGQSAIYHGGINGLCFQKTLHRFRAVPGGPSPEFAQTVFRANVQTGVFRRLASITTNIAHLTLVKFKASPFPLPPAAEQQRIVSEVARLLSIAEEAKTAIAHQGRRATALRQAILKWAFEGKLVDQDPNDEPADALLARIRTERAAAGATKRNGRPGGRRKRDEE